MPALSRQVRCRGNASRGGVLDIAEVTHPLGVVQPEHPLGRLCDRGPDTLGHAAGNRADGIYSIVEGAVELTHIRDTGEQITLRLGPGDHFGEGVLIGEYRRRSTVRALENSKVLLMEKEAYLKMVDAFPALRTYFDDHLKNTYGMVGE